jgi:hypothetical protein
VCNSSTTIHLVSAALLGPDPTWIDPSGPAPQQPARFPPSGLLQLYDANGTTATHRAEWVVYDGLVNRGDVSYALNYQGFDAGQRGQRRTAFAARDLGDTVFAFPAGTRVLPVQNGPYTVETGDVLTVARQRLSPVASERPWQGVVRFAEKDGWGAPGALGALTTSDPTTGRPYDTNNSQFAFCEAVPEHLARQPVHLLCWPCWTAPRDLTTVNDGVNDNPVTLLDLLPWGNAWATGVLEAAAGSGDDRRVCLGADDGRDSHNIVAATPATMAIDALWSGTQPAQGNASLQVVEVQRPPATTINPVVNPATVWVDATETPAALVGVTLAIPGLPGTGSDHLLASVGGEVMALRHLRDPLNSGYLQRAAIVGRALLGSTARAHHGREPVLILPIGPVTPLLSTLSPTDQRDTDPPVPAPPTPAPDRLFPELDAPALMLMDADGSAPTNHPEVLMAPNRWVAPWLRGMYGTPVGMWTVTPGTPGPLVVGWWPRFPSALPRVVPSTWTGDARKAWTNALFRSRSYAWAGFPLRFHDATFYAAGTNGVPITASDFLGAQVEVIDDAGGQFQIGVRALDAGSDWQHARALRPQAGGGSALGVFDVSDVFAYDRFRRAADGIHRLDVSWQRNDPIPVDGAELRVTWHAAVSTASTMNGALLDLARHNRAPMIGAVRLRCQAPSRVLAIEAPR